MIKDNKRNNNRRDKSKEKPEFDQTIVDLARVTRVTKGGKQLNFRACVLIGDRRGRVGYGVEKGKDVQIAVDKAVNQAKKNMITVPFADSIPHAVYAKYGAAKIMLKPAPKGSGIIAGSSIRTVLEMAGVPNASAKMLGKSSNKISNIKATFEALQSFKYEAVERTLQRKARNFIPKLSAVPVVLKTDVKTVQTAQIVKKDNVKKVETNKKEEIKKPEEQK